MTDEMTEIKQMNFGWLHAPPFPPACCHCLMVRSGTGVVLVDTGIGLQDIADPVGRIGQEAIDAAGFLFLPAITAVRQLEQLGIRPMEVSDIVLTHFDPDHVGGLADFPQAKIHVAEEEKRNLDSGNPRYSAAQFAHKPNWITYETDDCDTLGVASRRVHTALGIDIRLVPLFGHTNGHCGVAIQANDAWTLHVGDAYYLRDELTNTKHPVDELATLRADDNQRRLESLEVLRQLTRRTDVELTYFGYHDVGELPGDILRLEDVLKELKGYGTEQNRKVYRRHGVGGDVYGVSYAHLGKLQKAIGLDQELALALCDSGVHDARVLATMVADPQAMKSGDLERWCKSLDNYVVTDAFVKLAGKSRFAQAKMKKWIRSRNEWIASAGWGVAGSLALQDEGLSGEEMDGLLETIEGDIHQQKNRVRHAMNMTLISIGLHSEAFKRKAKAAAKRIGKVEVDHGETNCKTPDA
ncbi:Probable metallo-hydrolase Rv2300c, partial [Durusdinium trenchii]